MDNKFIEIGVQDSTFGDYAQIEINQTIHVPRVSSPIPSDERSGSPNFVGRVQDLNDLHQALQQEDVVAVCAVRTIAVFLGTDLLKKLGQTVSQSLTEKVTGNFVVIFLLVATGAIAKI